ncbi:MAG: O-antigen ligase domain-containing protein [Candidatus Electrothrix sp. AX5]|nr:O-antigen ligase domain-containing protein [Candidatus Electrothrix sp. AX5]
MAFSIFLLFTASYFLRFTARFPALGAVRFDMLLYLILVVCALAAKGNTEKGENDRIVDALIKFFYCAMLSVPLAMWPGSVMRAGLPNFLKSVLFFLYIARFVNTEKKLKLFVVVFLGCQIFRGLEPAYLHLTEGYWGSFAASDVGTGKLQILERLSGAPADIVNPNQLAWAINNIFPFIYYLGWQAEKKYLRLGAIALAGILMYPLMLTGSRTGIVALIGILIGITWQGENRLKRLAIMFMVVLPGMMLISSLLNPAMAERYRSLVDSSAAGADTTQGRITGLQRNLSTAMNVHGIFGHGFGTTAEVNMHYLGGAQPSHNLYLETLQEVGVVGLFFLLRYIATILSVLKSTKADLKHISTSYLFRLIMALQVWIFYQLIYSLACFGLLSWEWYLFGGLALVTVRIAIEENRNGEKDKIDILNTTEPA